MNHLKHTSSCAITMHHANRSAKSQNIFEKQTSDGRDNKRICHFNVNVNVFKKRSKANIRWTSIKMVKTAHFYANKTKQKLKCRKGTPGLAVVALFLYVSYEYWMVVLCRVHSRAEHSDSIWLRNQRHTHQMEDWYERTIEDVAHQTARQTER